MILKIVRNFTEHSFLPFYSSHSSMSVLTFRQNNMYLFFSHFLVHSCNEIWHWKIISNLILSSSWWVWDISGTWRSDSSRTPAAPSPGRCCHKPRASSCLRWSPGPRLWLLLCSWRTHTIMHSSSVRLIEQGHWWIFVDILFLMYIQYIYYILMPYTQDTILYVPHNFSEWSCFSSIRCPTQTPTMA